MMENWNTIYTDAKTTVFSEIISTEKDQTNYAYWQWASNYFTGSNVSYEEITDTVTGYPEFDYWLTYYCGPTTSVITGVTVDGAMSAANWAIFSDVKMYRDLTSETGNMEYLFALTNSTQGDPAANSLFNLTTLKTLVSLGQGTANIISSKDEIYQSTFELPEEWATLATTLELNDDTDDANGIG